MLCRGAWSALLARASGLWIQVKREPVMIRVMMTPTMVFKNKYGESRGNAKAAKRVATGAQCGAYGHLLGSERGIGPTSET